MYHIFFHLNIIVIKLQTNKQLPKLKLQQKPTITIMKSPQLIGGPPQVLVPSVHQQAVLERVRRVPAAAARPRLRRAPHAARAPRAARLGQARLS